jgi:hypothetical protein
MNNYQHGVDFLPVTKLIGSFEVVICRICHFSIKCYIEHRRRSFEIAPMVLVSSTVSTRLLFYDHNRTARIGHNS